MDLFNRSNDLFPTKSSFAIFVSYITLFVSQGLLVTAVHKSQIIGFNAIVVVLLTELLKLSICIVLYLIRSQGSIFFTGQRYKAKSKTTTTISRTILLVLLV